MKLFWKKHLRKRSFNLNTFRNTKKHNIFANWSPYSRGLTYHNFLINFFVNRDKKKFIKFKKSINNLNIGHPPHVLYDDKFFITYDDCLSYEEFYFLKKNLRYKKDLNVIEIGPGYGRSVEYIINNFPISKYFVIDYSKILILTKKYLKCVLSKEQYKKIEFCDFEKYRFEKNYFKKNYKINKFDLVFNSDSFHEIEKKIINKYLKYFSNLASNFFIKNAVAKYKITDLVDHLSNKDVPRFNKNLGLCNKTINVFDNKQISKNSKIFLKKYNPYKKGSVISRMSEIYPTCMLALFSKKNN
jgi:putative sugar O-methyltransferase